MELSPRPSNNQGNNVLRYTSIATQMGITIFLGVWLGMKADERWPEKVPIYTLVGSLTGVVIAVYRVIRDVLKK
ncbi:MAG: AtpZ/AtpI family protein [Flavobacteriales bacterium]